MALDIQRITALRPQNSLHYFATIDSTMVEAAKLASSGAPHGTLVVADEQIAGQGRFGRTWVSEPELGIYCSLLLRLPLPPEQLPVAALLFGLATAEAIQRVTDLTCDLRWPNDVLVRERKVAGILAQLSDSCIIAGIGVNVNQLQMPSNFRTPPSSLRIESGGKTHSREALLVALLEAIDSFSSILVTQGRDEILRAFVAASSYANNRRVRIEETGITGVTAGLDTNGFLLLRTDRGDLERVASGGVRPQA